MGPVGAIWPTFTFLFGPDRFHTLDFRYRILFSFFTTARVVGETNCTKIKSFFFPFYRDSGEMTFGPKASWTSCIATTRFGVCFPFF